MVKSNKKLTQLIRKKEKQNESNKLSNLQFKKAMSALGKMETDEPAEAPNAFEDPEGFQKFHMDQTQGDLSLGSGKSGFNFDLDLESDSESENRTEFEDVKSINKFSFQGSGLKKNKGKVIGKAARRRKLRKMEREEGYSDRLEERSIKAFVKDIAIENRKRLKRRRRAQ